MSAIVKNIQLPESKSNTIKSVGTFLQFITILVLVLESVLTIALFVSDGIDKTIVIAGIIISTMVLAGMVVFVSVVSPKIIREELEVSAKNIENRCIDDVQFELSRTNFTEAISSDISNSTIGDEIDMLGTVHKNIFTDMPGCKVIANKVVKGAKFRVIILHPESELLKIYQNLSKNFGTPDLKMSILESATGTIYQTFKFVEKAKEVSGSIEVRLHKNVLSSGFYYGSHSLNLFSPYLAHERGTSCHAYNVHKKELKNELRNHFEAIWEQSSEYVLAKVDTKEFVDNLSELTQEKNANNAS